MSAREFCSPVLFLFCSLGLSLKLTLFVIISALSTSLLHTFEHWRLERPKYERHSWAASNQNLVTHSFPRWAVGEAAGLFSTSLLRVFGALSLVTSIYDVRTCKKITQMFKLPFTDKGVDGRNIQNLLGRLI